MITGVFISRRNHYYEDQEKQELVNAGNVASEKIERLLNQGMVATNTLSFIVQKYGIGNNFDEIAKRILSANTGIDALELVEGGTITHVYPLKSNEEAIGYNILLDTSRNKEAFKAIVNNNVFYAGPLKLKQGGMGIIGRLPIVIDSEYWGFSSVIIKLSTIIRFAGLAASARNIYTYQFSKINPDTHQEEFFLPKTARFDLANSIKIFIPDGEWNIYVKKTAKAPLPYASFIQILGVLFSVLIGVFSFYIARQPVRLQRLVDEKAIELKKAEIEIIESEEKFRTLVEQSLVGAFIIQNHKLTYVSPGFELMTGYSKHELLNEMTFEGIIHEDDLDRVKMMYNESEIQMHVASDLPIKIISREGIVKQIEVVASGILYKNMPAVIGTIIDITQKAEETKRLNQAVFDAQEKERQQLGMELHDNVQQILSASSLNLDVLKREVKGTPMADQIFRNLKNYMQEANNELRRLSQQLAPSMDPSISLKDRIRSLTDSINIGGGLNVELDIDNNTPLPEKMELNFFRIIQEQMTNIIKYADTSSAKISVRAVEDYIILRIIDEGKGFDTQLPKNGIGLENIRKRAEFMNGRSSVWSAPGEGTCVTVHVPV
ncbi:MAG: PAS domain S-box protein [Ginsengibacter sp.]